jgi:hypothetical protein
MTPLEMHKKMFPNVMLNFFQMDLIEAEIQDADAWKETLYFWAGNDYRGQSVFKMIELYKQKLEDRNKGRWQDVGRPIETESYPDCSTCDNTRRIGSWDSGIRCPDCVLETV